MMGTVALPVGAAAGFASLVSAGEEFDRKMRNSLAIMGRVSTALKQDMRDAAIEASRTTQFTAAQAAESYFFLASAGLDAKQSIAALPQVAQFAQAGMFDMARATDLATDAQSALGLTVADAGRNLANLSRVTDVLIKANTLANASAEQFSVALTTKAAVSARNAGKDIEETVAVLAAFADQGIKAEIAGTAFSIIMRDLQTKARQNAAAFKEAGIEVFNQAGEMNNLAEITADLEKALAGMSVEQQAATIAQLGFSDKSKVFLQTLIGTSRRIRDYEAALRGAEGITEKIAREQMTPMQRGLADFGSEWSKLGATVSRVVGPVAEAVLSMGGIIIGTFSRVADAIGIIVGSGKDMEESIGGAAPAAGELATQLGNVGRQGIGVQETANALQQLGRTLKRTRSDVSDLRPALAEVGQSFQKVFATAASVAQAAQQEGFFGDFGQGFGAERDFLDQADALDELQEKIKVFAQQGGQLGISAQDTAESVRFAQNAINDMRTALVSARDGSLSLEERQNAIAEASSNLGSVLREEFGEIQNIFSQAFEPLTPAQERIKSMQEELRRLAMGSSEAADNFLEFTKLPGVSQEEIDQFGELASKIEDLKIAAKDRKEAEQERQRQEKEAKRESESKMESAKRRAESIAESVRTPFERLSQNLKEIQSLRDRGLLTEEQAARATAAAQREQAPMPARIGFAELGRSIQDQLLGGDIPMKHFQEAQKQTTIQQQQLEEQRRQQGGLVAGEE